MVKRETCFDILKDNDIKLSVLFMRTLDVFYENDFFYMQHV